MNYAIIFAGGLGTRMKTGDKPKQFLEIGGKSILCHTIDKFQKCSEIDGIVLVTNADYLDYTKSIVLKENYTKILNIVSGGANPIDSQYNGILALKSVAKPNDIILLHDGVRPLIDEDTILKCINIAKKSGNAITVARAIETIALADEQNLIHKTVTRDKCFLARAPQCARFEELVYYHDLSIKEGVHNFIDTASMLLYYGKELNSVMGPQDNIKVTTITDYYMCKVLFENMVNDDE